MGDRYGDSNNTTVYVGNLDPRTTDGHLIDLFEKYGRIESGKH